MKSTEKKLVTASDLDNCASIKPADSTKEKKSKHREIVFRVSKTSLYTFLRLKEVNGKAYHLPLWNVKSKKGRESSKGKENVLIPIVPMRFVTPEYDEMHTERLREGWVYIYVDGYLWRELHVNDNHCFSDVNLETENGKSERKAKGEIDTRILLPYKVTGTKPKIEIAFSETQWHWNYINSMGGMKDDDPRIDVKNKPEMPSDINGTESKAKKLREKRMQVVYLDGYDDKVKFKQNTPKENVALTSNITAKANEYGFILDRKSEIPVITIKDPLGVARLLQFRLARAVTELEVFYAQVQGLYKDGKIIKPDSLQGKEAEKYRHKASLFNMATVVNNYFYLSVDRITGEKERYEALTSDERKAIDNKKKWREDYLDYDRIKVQLEYDELIAKVDDVQRARSLLIAYMNDGYLKSEKSNKQCTLFDVLGDYFSSGLLGYTKGIETINDLILFTTDNPAKNVNLLLSDIRDQDFFSLFNAGEDMINRLHGTHPDKSLNSVLASYQFAPQSDKDDKNILACKKINVDPGVPEYNYNLFIPSKTSETHDHVMNFSQIIRRATQALNLRSASLASAAYKITRRQESGVKEKIEERIKKLKAAQIKTAKEINSLKADIKKTQKHHDAAVDSHSKAEKDLIGHRATTNIKLEQVNRQVRKAANKRIARVSETLRELTLLDSELKAELTQLDAFKANKLKGYASVKSGFHIKPVMRTIANITKLEADLKDQGFEIKKIKISLDDLKNDRLPKGYIRLNHKELGYRYKQTITDMEELLKDDGRLKIAIGENGKFGAISLDSALNLDSHAMQAHQLMQEDLLRSATGTMNDVLGIDMSPSNTMVEIYVLVDNEEVEAEKKKAEKKRKADANTAKQKETQLKKKVRAAEKRVKPGIDKQINVETLTKAQKLFSERLNRYTSLLNYKNWDAKKKSNLSFKFTSMMGVMEVFNLWASYDAYKKSNSERDLAAFSSTILDVAATMASITELVFNKKHGSYSIVQIKFNEYELAKKAGNAKNFARKPMGYATKYFYRGLTILVPVVNVVATVISGLVAVNDALIAAAKGDTSAMVGNYVMVAGFITGTGALAAQVMGMTMLASSLGILGIILLIIGAIILWWYFKEPMEHWLINGPFGKDKKQFAAQGEKELGVVFTQENPYFHWIDDYQYAYLALMNLIAAPQVVYGLTRRPIIDREHGPSTIDVLQISVYVPNLINKDGIETKFEVATPDGKIERFDLANVAVKSSFKGADWEPLPNNMGYRVSLNIRESFGSLLAKHKRIMLRVSVRTWPNGKKKTLFQGSTIEYRLPDPKRKFDGSYKETVKGVHDSSYSSAQHPLASIQAALHQGIKHIRLKEK